MTLYLPAGHGIVSKTCCCQHPALLAGLCAVGLHLEIRIIAELARALHLTPGSSCFLMVRGGCLNPLAKQHGFWPLATQGIVLIASHELSAIGLLQGIPTVLTPNLISSVVTWTPSSSPEASQGQPRSSTWPSKLFSGDLRPCAPLYLITAPWQYLPGCAP